MANWNPPRTIERPIGQVLHEVKEEIKEFITTRVGVARAELSEKTALWKKVAPIAVIGATITFIASLLLTASLVAALVWAFGSAGYTWAAALAIVGVLYGVVGVACLVYVAGILRSNSLKLERTLGVLRQDQLWICAETRYDHDQSPIK